MNSSTGGIGKPPTAPTTSGPRPQTLHPARQPPGRGTPPRAAGSRRPRRSAGAGSRGRGGMSIDGEARLRVLRRRRRRAPTPGPGSPITRSWPCRASSANVAGDVLAGVGRDDPGPGPGAARGPRERGADELADAQSLSPGRRWAGRARRSAAGAARAAATRERRRAPRPAIPRSPRPGPGRLERPAPGTRIRPATIAAPHGRQLPQHPPRHARRDPPELGAAPPQAERRCRVPRAAGHSRAWRMSSAKPRS